jgi:hypothetical protein
MVVIFFKRRYVREKGNPFVGKHLDVTSVINM